MVLHVTDLLGSLLPRDHRWKIALFTQWESIIGPLHHHVRIESIQNSTLVLGVSHPVWAQELHALSDILKDKINALLVDHPITDIRFKVIASKEAAKDAAKRQSSSARSAQKCKNIPLTPQELLSLNRIKDDDLRKTLESYREFIVKK